MASRKDDVAAMASASDSKNRIAGVMLGRETKYLRDTYLFKYSCSRSFADRGSGEWKGISFVLDLIPPRRKGKAISEPKFFGEIPAKRKWRS